MSGCHNPLPEFWTSLKKFLKFWYLLIPISVYLLMLIIYPHVEKAIYTEQQLSCTAKSSIIIADETIFYWLYGPVETSFDPALLIFSSIPYLMHFVTPALYILWILLAKKGWCCFLQYAFTLGLTCAVSISIEYALPTAPPWIFLNLPPQAKFFVVDDVLNISLFYKLYGLNKLICGAFPSLHTSWPTVNLFNGHMNPYLGMLHVGAIMFAAIYSSHHRIFDIAVGFTIALVMTLAGRKIIECLQKRQAADDKPENLVNELNSEPNPNIQVVDPPKSDQIQKKQQPVPFSQQQLVRVAYA